MFIYNLDFTYKCFYYCNYVYCAFLEEKQKYIIYYKSTSFEITTLLWHLSSLTASYAAEFPDTVNDVPFFLYFYFQLLYSNNFQHARKICVPIKNFFHTQDERKLLKEKYSVVSWVAIEKIARVHRIFYFGCAIIIGVICRGRKKNWSGYMNAVIKFVTLACLPANNKLSHIEAVVANYIYMLAIIHTVRFQLNRIK